MHPAGRGLHPAGQRPRGRHPVPGGPAGPVSGCRPAAGQGRPARCCGLPAAQPDSAKPAAGWGHPPARQGRCRLQQGWRPALPAGCGASRPVPRPAARHPVPASAPGTARPARRRRSGRCGPGSPVRSGHPTGRHPRRGGCSQLWRHPVRAGRRPARPVARPAAGPIARPAGRLPAAAVWHPAGLRCRQGMRRRPPVRPAGAAAAPPIRSARWQARSGHRGRPARRRPGRRVRPAARPAGCPAGCSGPDAAGSGGKLLPADGPAIWRTAGCGTACGKCGCAPRWRRSAAG